MTPGTERSKAGTGAASLGEPGQQPASDARVDVAGDAAVGGVGGYLGDGVDDAVGVGGCGGDDEDRVLVAERGHRGRVGPVGHGVDGCAAHGDPQIAVGLVEGGVGGDGDDDLRGEDVRAGVPCGLHREDDRLGSAAGEDAGGGVVAAEAGGGRADDLAFEGDDAGERGRIQTVDLHHRQVGPFGGLAYFGTAAVVDVGGGVAAPGGQVGGGEDGEFGEEVGAGAAGLGQARVGGRGVGGGLLRGRHRVVSVSRTARRRP